MKIFFFLFSFFLLLFFQRCLFLEEIALIWQRESQDLRNFTEIERETFQSTINEMIEELNQKNQRIQQLNEKIERYEQEKVSFRFFPLSSYLPFFRC